MRVALPSICGTMPSRPVFTPRCRLLLLGTFYLLLLPCLTHSTFFDAREACQDFASPSTGSNNTSLFWTFDQCSEVWNAWYSTLFLGPRSYTDRRPFREMAQELRRRGHPCLVQAGVVGDGVGSTFMRLLATWLYAREVGCDWVTPQFGRVRKKHGIMTYCHRSVPAEERGSGPVKPDNRCEKVDWMDFFNLEAPTVRLPSDARFEIYQVTDRHQVPMPEALADVERIGWNNLSGNYRVMLNIDPSVAARFAINEGGWTAYKRSLARDILAEAKRNFHESPQPGHPELPECGFGGHSQLDFAIHVRMGDRRTFVLTDATYFDLLEAFMLTVTAGVEARNKNSGSSLPLPMFHVFSETAQPCPSANSRTFEEFPTWPLEAQEVPQRLLGAGLVECCTSDHFANYFPTRLLYRGLMLWGARAEQEMDENQGIDSCLVRLAGAPQWCPEGRAETGPCTPEPQRIFRVEGKPIMLHVGDTASDTLSCMIHADGVLMGCSTFGQVAGLLTRGISFFSQACEGSHSPAQYRMVPPMAIAEYGSMWVPIAGAWRDPRLEKIEIFEKALEHLLNDLGL